MRSLSDVIVFDLDDTLYNEISFVESGFKAVSHYLGYPSYADEMMSSWEEGKNAFEQLINNHSLCVSIDELLKVYRTHEPSINLDPSTSLSPTKRFPQRFRRWSIPAASMWRWSTRRSKGFTRLSRRIPATGTSRATIRRRAATVWSTAPLCVTTKVGLKEGEKWLV